MGDGQSETIRRNSNNNKKKKKIMASVTVVALLLLLIAGYSRGAANRSKIMFDDEVQQANRIIGGTKLAPPNETSSTRITWSRYKPPTDIIVEGH